MRQCACALKCGVLARAKYARRSTISRGTAAVGLWGSDCPRPALLNHQPTSLLSSPNTCRPPSTPTAPHLHQESTLDAKELSDALPLWSPPEHPFHRIPQRSATATSDIFIHHLLKIQTQTCSYDYIYCLYHWWGGRKCTVLPYFLRTSRWLPPFPCILHQPSYAGQ